jgi:ribose transport system permease protein
MAKKEEIEINKIEQNNMLKKRIRSTFLGPYGVALLIVPLAIIFAVLNPRFLSIANIINVLRQASIIGIMACGMTVVLLTGNIDLSVGSVVALAGVVTAWSICAGIPTILAILIGLLLGAAAGFINGWLTAKFNIPSLLITVGSMNAIRGIAYLITGGRPITGLPDSFAFLGAGYFLGIPIPVYIMLIIILLSWYFLQFMVLGRHVYAVGSNSEAARLSGINKRHIITLSLTISGLFSAVSGIVLAARLSSGQPIVGMGYELQVIAASVLGGVSLNGGQGRVIGAVIGAILIGIMNNGLNLVRVSPYWQQVLIGMIIVSAVIIDKLRQESK